MTHYSERALPRTTVGGQPVAGMTRAELVGVLQQRFDSVSVTLQPAAGAARQARLADLGYTLDVERTVDSALAANASWSSSSAHP